MNYTEARAKLEALRARSAVSSAALKTFPRNAMGMTTDEARATLEWRAARARFDLDWAAERSFTGWFIKAFKKEYAADRAARLSPQ